MASPSGGGGDAGGLLVRLASIPGGSTGLDGSKESGLAVADEATYRVNYSSKLVVWRRVVPPEPSKEKRGALLAPASGPVPR